MVSKNTAVTGRVEGSKKQHAERRLITVFSVGEIRFAINVENMVEIVQLSNISGDSEKKYVIGWVDLKGKKVPVLDFEGFFRIASSAEGRGIRSMILLKRNGSGAAQPVVAGVIVDRIEVVRQESELAFFPFPTVAQDDKTRVYQGVLVKDHELVFLLDIGLLMDRVWGAQ